MSMKPVWIAGISRMSEQSYLICEFNKLGSYYLSKTQYIKYEKLSSYDGVKRKNTDG